MCGYDALGGLSIRDKRATGATTTANSDRGAMVENQKTNAITFLDNGRWLIMGEHKSCI